MALIAKGMKALVLSSGGKDSILALHKAWQQGLKVVGIITMLPEDPESMLYHTHNVQYVEEMAESMGLRWYGIEASKEEEEDALERTLKSLDANILVTGGVSSNYQMEKFTRIAEAANMHHLAPLWGNSPQGVLQEVLAMRMEVMITAVAAYGLDEGWLGRLLTEESVTELLRLSEKYRFNPIGEGGDLDSFVLDAPSYRKRLVPMKMAKKWYGDRGALDIQELKMVQKGDNG